MNSQNLINSAECRKFALKWAKENRKGCSFERVSKQFLDDLNTKVRITIQRAVNSHPSVGKTLKDLL